MNDLARRRRKEQQEIELAVGQHEHVAAQSRFHRVTVDDEVTEVEPVIHTRHLDRGCRPAELGMDPRHELAWQERFHDVVVGADLQSENTVRLFIGAADDDDRKLVALAQHAQDREAVDARQTDVEDDQIERVVDDAQRLLTGGRLGHHQVARFESMPQERAHVVVVVDEQHRRRSRQNRHNRHLIQLVGTLGGSFVKTIAKTYVVNVGLVSILR